MKHWNISKNQQDKGADHHSKIVKSREPLQTMPTVSLSNYEFGVLSWK